MDRKEFKQFCMAEFKKRGFMKIKNTYYLEGDEVLCAINLQKSNYGNIYYVNYYYFIGNYKELTTYPTYYDSDIEGRIAVMSKTQTYQGKHFMTAQVEYEEYSADELRPFFAKEFEEKILPPIFQGKKYILENINKLYFLTLNQDEVMRKLQG